jgi:predicted small integral membrane protein
VSEEDDRGKVSRAKQLAAKRGSPRGHFLPIETNAFDRVFISVVSGVLLHLVWMRFVEDLLPLWVATVLVVALGYLIVTRG